MAIQPLFDEPFLRAQWDAEFIAFQASPEAAALRDANITEAFDATIAEKETTLNTQIYRLYQLTPEEMATVEAG